MMVKEDYLQRDLQLVIYLYFPDNVISLLNKYSLLKYAKLSSV